MHTEEDESTKGSQCAKEALQGSATSMAKKDKYTTEQAFFTCHVCDCDLKSVITLRAHCRGIQHMNKARQKKKELELQQARQPINQDSGQARLRRSETPPDRGPQPGTGGRESWSPTGRCLELGPNLAWIL